MISETTVEHEVVNVTVKRGTVSVDDFPFRGRWPTLASLCISMLITGYISVRLGPDKNWDLLNYHFYNGFALLHGLESQNDMPAQLQTYFNPVLDSITYLGIHSSHPIFFGAALGAFQGIAIWLAFNIADRLFKFHSPWLQWFLCLAVSIIGIASPSAYLEIGETMGDLTTAVFVLGSILLIVDSIVREETGRAAFLRFGIAGLLLGCAIGLKYTNYPIILGMAAGLLVIVRSIDFKRLVVMGVGVVLSFLVTAGPWMVYLYQQWGNPFYPLFNGIFKSPYAQATNFTDTRFMPTSLAQAIFLPFYFTRSTHLHTSELTFQNLSFAVIYLLLLIGSVVGGTYLWRTRVRWAENWQGATSIKVPMHAAQIFLLVAFVVSFVLWEKGFSIYRYLTVQEFLAPILVVVLGNWLIKREQVRSVGVIVLLMFVAVTIIPATDGTRVPGWANGYFNVQVPTLSDPTHSLVLMTSGDPMAYVIPYFDTKTQFVRIQSNFDELVSPKYLNRRSSEILNHQGPIYIMTTTNNVSAVDALLQPYSLSLETASCQVIMGTSLNINSISFCSAQPAK